MHSVSAPNENVYTTQIVFLYEAISKDMLELTVQSMMVRQTCIYHAGIKNSVYEYQSQFLIITTSAVRILLHYTALSNSISALYTYVHVALLQNKYGIHTCIMHMEHTQDYV